MLKVLHSEELVDVMRDQETVDFVRQNIIKEDNHLEVNKQISC